MSDRLCLLLQRIDQQGSLSQATNKPMVKKRASFVQPSRWCAVGLQLISTKQPHSICLFAQKYRELLCWQLLDAAVHLYRCCGGGHRSTLEDSKTVWRKRTRQLATADECTCAIYCVGTWDWGSIIAILSRHTRTHQMPVLEAVWQQSFPWPTLPWIRFFRRFQCYFLVLISVIFDTIKLKGK